MALPAAEEEVGEVAPLTHAELYAGAACDRPWVAHRFIVRVPGGELNATQLVDAAIALKEANPDAIIHGVILGALEDEIGCAWVVSRGAIAGTWPKRLATWFRRNCREWLTPAVATCIARLGAKYGPEVNSATEYHCDITGDLDWSRGAFGDSGSCFWGTNRAARDRMVEDGTLALRLYRPGTGDGYARAWLSVVWDGNAGQLLPVVWNAYGASLVTFARILATVTGWSYSAVELSNKGATTGLIYVNGGTGYALHPVDVAPSAALDLDIDDSTSCPSCGADEECGECDNCSERSCDCGWCDKCEHTRCECECCSYCGTNNRCGECDRCHDCGRRQGE